MSHEPEPDDDDLLIRSLSSLLNLIKPQVTEGLSVEDKNSKKKRLQKPDRLALLFVTEGCQQVVAVAASLSPGSAVLWVVPDGSSNTIGTPSCVDGDLSEPL